MVKDRKWTVFSDGACRGNPGPGGWGAIVALAPESEVVELGGFEPATTNNIMELTAVLRALEFVEQKQEQLKPYEQVEILVHSDSKYVLEGVTKWRFGWRNRNWKKQDGEEISNLRLWQELDALCDRLAVKAKMHWQYVAGHSGIPGNERCDEIASKFAESTFPELYSGPLLNYSIDLAVIDVPATTKRKNKTIAEPGYPIYLSLVRGELREHATWAECNQRVHGQSGAKYKKVSSEFEKDEVLKSWGISS